MRLLSKINVVKLPERIKVGETWYTIQYHGELYDEKNQKLYGNCDFTSATIKIVPNPKCWKNTLRHELTHAVSYFMNAGLKERQIDQMTNGLGMLFIDNPALKDVIL